MTIKDLHTRDDLEEPGKGASEDNLPHTRKIVVGSIDSRMRLDKYLLEQEEGISRMRFKHLIEEGHILLNGKPAKASQKVKPLDEVLIEIPPPKTLSLIPEDIKLDILYEDEHLIAVNKPAGMVVHPAAGHYEGTLVHALLYHCKDLSGVGGKLRPGVVHRLDKGTTGVIISAKHDQAHHTLQKMFKVHQLEKRYIAITDGVPRERSGCMQSFIGRHPIHRKKMASITDGGKSAITHFRVLSDYGRFAKLRLDLETGRTHQIRVHLSDMKTPIVGDYDYGKHRRHKTGDEVLDKLLDEMRRPALHARRLSLSHPISGEPLILEAPIPPDMEAILKRLAIWSKRRGDA